MKCFEDYEVGESFEHGAYAVNAEEIMAFARQYDPQRSISIWQPQQRACSAG